MDYTSIINDWHESKGTKPTLKYLNENDVVKCKLESEICTVIGIGFDNESAMINAYRNAFEKYKLRFKSEISEPEPVKPIFKPKLEIGSFRSSRLIVNGSNNYNYRSGSRIISSKDFRISNSNESLADFDWIGPSNPINFIKEWHDKNSTKQPKYDYDEENGLKVCIFKSSICTTKGKGLNKKVAKRIASALAWKIYMNSDESPKDDSEDSEDPESSDLYLDYSEDFDIEVESTDFDSTSMSKSEPTEYMLFDLDNIVNLIKIKIPKNIYKIGFRSRLSSMPVHRIKSYLNEVKTINSGDKDAADVLMIATVGELLEKTNSNCIIYLVSRDHFIYPLKEVIESKGGKGIIFTEASEILNFSFS